MNTISTDTRTCPTCRQVRPLDAEHRCAGTDRTLLERTDRPLWIKMLYGLSALVSVTVVYWLWRVLT